MFYPTSYDPSFLGKLGFWLLYAAVFKVVAGLVMRWKRASKETTLPDGVGTKTEGS